MKRPYALHKLLEHGELSGREIKEITGWTNKQVYATIGALCKANIVRKLPKLKWGLLKLNPYPHVVQSQNNLRCW
jgi:hypothetical protein